MEINTDLIISLHKIDKKLNAIHESKGELPSQISKEENKIKEIKESIMLSENKIKDLSTDKTSFDLSINEFKDLIEKYNKQIFQVKSNKEYDALLKEIDHIEEKNKELTDSINNIEIEIKENEDLKKDLQEKVDKMAESLDSNKKELEVVSVETKTEENLLLKEKTTILNNIKDKDFLKQYDNSTSKSILETISRGSCDNCYSSLPDQLILDIKKGNNLYICPDCGIYLYFDGEEEN